MHTASLPIASNVQRLGVIGDEPDVVKACAGDVPRIETVAAAWLLQKYVPGIKVRVVNVVDITALYRPDDHPHDGTSIIDAFTDA